ncbi:SH3 domain-containing protein [Tenacibaculum sp. 190524A05c]|uniref:SH3 domain-containing protein n=1 Tax=Tenacibaculum platacis TaxID=3137852 RepID=UPI0031FB435A
MIRFIKNRVSFFRLIILLGLFLISSCNLNEGVKQNKQIKISDKISKKNKQNFKRSLSNKQKKIKINDLINQRLFFIEKETDSSYQIGSFGILSPSNPGNIAGWKRFEKDMFIILFRGGEEFYEREMKIYKIQENQILVKNSEGEKIRFSVGRKDWDSHVLYVKEETDYDSDIIKSYTWYVLRENDVDSAYIFNRYKENERIQLVEEYGDKYKEMINNNEIDAYQHTPDSIYMKYVLKDHYNFGTLIEDDCNAIVGVNVFLDNKSIKISQNGKHYFVSDFASDFNELVKIIYKDGDEFVVISDVVSKEDGNEFDPNLKDRILRFKKDSGDWKATQSFGTEIIYKSLPVFFVNDKVGLNVRNKPSVEGEKITKLEYNEKVYVTDTLQSQVIGKLKGEWLEITLPVGDGYIFSPYISKSPNSKSPD